VLFGVAPIEHGLHLLPKLRRREWLVLTTGDRPTLVESSRRWLALDIDRLMLPPELAATDLSGCGELAIAALPNPFSPASVIVQATAGHLIKPGARLRLWFWLSRPVTQSELKLWLRSAPVDVAVFRPAQLIFTAAPVFANDAVDPMPCRTISIVQSQPVVAVSSRGSHTVVPTEARPIANSR
jgi:hypothetical protein